MADDSKSYRPMLHAPVGWMLGELVAACSGVQGLALMATLHLMVNRSVKDDEDLTASLPLWGMDASVQFGFVRALGRARLKKEDAEKLEKITNKIEEVFDFRNLLAHGVWEPGKDHDTMIVHQFKPMSKKQPEVMRLVTAKDISEQLVKLMNGTGDMVNLLKAHGYLADLAPHHGRFF